MLELQADFLAGVWAHYEQKKNNIIEKGDIEEALNAANAIGDDRLQKRPKVLLCPMHLRMVHRSNGFTGSGKDWRQVTCLREILLARFQLDNRIRHISLLRILMYSPYKSFPPFGPT